MNMSVEHCVLVLNKTSITLTGNTAGLQYKSHTEINRCTRSKLKGSINLMKFNMNVNIFHILIERRYSPILLHAYNQIHYAMYHVL